MRGLRAFILGAMVAAAPGLVAGQDYPTQDITLVVPYPAGGPTDQIARLLANRMEQGLGRTMIVENLGGAGGTLGAGQAAKAEPDGYTLLLGNSAQLVLAQYVYPDISYDGYEAFEPVGLITKVPNVVVVPATSEFRSLTELLDYGKANPGKLTVGNTGIGTPPHVDVELLLQQTGVEAVQVPYKGSAPATTGFLGGEMDFMIDLPSVVRQLVDAGKARALATLDAERAPELPDVPTAREQGIDFASVVWFALMAPKGTPEEVLDILRDQMDAALTSSDVAETMKATGFAYVPMSPEAFREMMAAEAARNKAIVEAAGIRAQ